MSIKAPEQRVSRWSHCPSGGSARHGALSLSAWPSLLLKMRLFCANHTFLKVFQRSTYIDSIQNLTSTLSLLWHLKMREHQASFGASSLGNCSEAAAANESPFGLLEPRDGAGVNGAFCPQNRALDRTPAALILCWKPELERRVGATAANQFCLVPVGVSGLSVGLAARPRRSSGRNPKGIFLAFRGETSLPLLY